MQDLVHALVRDDVGARTLRLALYRVDGEVTTVDIGLAMPTRDAAHVARLIDLKLERLAETFEAGLNFEGFGFEALGLAVTAAERMEPRQMEMDSVADAHDTERCAALIDSLRQRLGPRSVQRLKPLASHLPERAETPCAATVEAPAWPAPDEARPRPLLLLPYAEPAEVIALVPEGPPQRFRWRGVMYDIARAQGPERIASEWWRNRAQQPTRDYYFVEDASGRRFWLYREGLYGRETSCAALVRAWDVCVRRTCVTAYAELAVTTNFSFLRGASHPQEMVKTADALGPCRHRHCRPQQLCRRGARLWRVEKRKSSSSFWSARVSSPSMASKSSPIRPTAKPMGGFAAC